MSIGYENIFRFPPTRTTGAPSPGIGPTRAGSTIEECGPVARALDQPNRLLDRGVGPVDDDGDLNDPHSLYVLYQHRDHFSSLVVTVVFAVYAGGVIASLLLVVTFLTGWAGAVFWRSGSL